MTHGGSVVGPVTVPRPLPCENLKFFLNLCLVFQLHYHFCYCHLFIILENIMENIGTVRTQVADRSLPQKQ